MNTPFKVKCEKRLVYSFMGQEWTDPRDTKRIVNTVALCNLADEMYPTTVEQRDAAKMFIKNNFDKIEEIIASGIDIGVAE